jgi:tetratricopeptide (TPR) repeat protein
LEYKLDCINCGGTLNSHIAGQVVACPYCGTTTAWIPKIEIDSQEISPEVDKLLKVAQIDIDAKRYSQALDLLGKAISLDPTCWQAYANLALAKFWIGDTSYRHLSEVKEMLMKAATFAKDPDLISKISSAISYNTVQVIKIQNPFGEGLVRAINAIHETNDLRPDYPEREILLDDFINESSSKIIDRLGSFLKRDNKSFDPPRTDLLTVATMLNLQLKPEPENLKKLLAYMAYKFSKMKNTDSELDEIYSTLCAKYLKLLNTDKTPVLKFGFFKGPLIE